MKTIGRLAIILLAGLVVCGAMWLFADSDLGSRLISEVGVGGVRARGELGRGGQGFRGGRLQGEAELREPGSAEPLSQARSEGSGFHRGERSAGVSTATLATWGRNLLVIGAIVLIVVLLERLISPKRAKPTQPAPC